MGKQLIIIGADFSAVSIDTAKVLSSISATITGTQYTNSAPTGLTVTAYYTDSTSSIVTTYTTNPAVWGSTVGSQTMTINYTKNGITKTTTVTANVQQGSGTTYTVSADITNGTATSVSVASGGTATLTVVPSSGHTNPTSVSISSGTCGTPTISGATITVPNVTSNVTIAATCPASGGGQHLTTTWTISQTVSDQGKVSGGSRCCSAYVDLSGYSGDSYIKLPGSSANGCGLACYNSNVTTSGSTTEFLGFLKDDKSLIGVNTSGHRWVVDSQPITLSFLRSLAHDGSGQVNGIVFMCYTNAVPSDYDIVVYS